MTLISVDAASLLARAGMSVWRRYLQDGTLRLRSGWTIFLANSRNVAAKIRKLYGRQATVIHPPVDLEKFRLGDGQEPYYLIVSALVPYKRIDIAIRAFNEMRLPLKIVGEGPLRSQLERSAGSNIEFLGWVDDSVLAALYGSVRHLFSREKKTLGLSRLRLSPVAGRSSHTRKAECWRR